MGNSNSTKEDKRSKLVYNSAQPTETTRGLMVNRSFGYNYESNRSATSVPYTSNSSSTKEHTHATKLQSKEVPKVKEYNPFSVQPKSEINTVVIRPFEYNHESNRPATSTSYTSNSSGIKEHTHATQLQPKEVPEVKKFNPFATNNNMRFNGPLIYNHESNRPVRIDHESIATSTPYTSNSNSTREHTHATQLQPQEVPEVKKYNPFAINNSMKPNGPFEYNHESNRPATSIPYTNNSNSTREHTQLQPKEVPEVKEFNPFAINNKVRSNGPFEYNHESNRSTGDQTISTQNNKSPSITATLPPKILTKDDFMRRWFLWKDEFLTYMKSIDQTEKDKQKWGIMLLNRMGPIGQEIHRSFIFNKDHETEEDIDILLKKFDFYCTFGGRKRGADEEIDKYVNSLTVMAMKHGNTEANTEQMLKEKILMEIDKDKFTKKAESLIPSFSFPSSVQSLTIKEMTYIWMSCENADFKRKEQFVGNNLIKNCRYCGREHKINNCPAYGKECNKCGNKDHFGPRCPSQYIDNCFYCGEGHFLRECIAYANICNECHKPNHFSWKCSVGKVLNCNFCGLTHIASKSKCPAINSFCTKCKRTGHFPSKCKWRN